MLVEKKDVFLRLLEKSGLLSESELAEARRYSEQEPADPISIAKRLIRAGVLNKWQANHLLRGRFALSLGKYPFLDQIDTGRDQRLYVSKDPNSGGLVELKVLSRRQSASDPAMVERFQDQGGRLASLNHPGLAKVHAMERVEGNCVLVAEHVAGRTLADVLSEGKPLPVETAAGYVLRVAEALAYAHGHGCVHGDLRPSHVILDEQGEVRVARLGFTSLVAASGGKTKDEGPAAEAEWCYLAPECRGEGAETTPAGDIYSLGAILFTLVTGRPPEGPQTATAVREARPDVPPTLAGLIERLLATSPGDRETDAEGVAQTLQAWMARQTAVANQGRAGRSANRSPKRASEKVGAIRPPAIPAGGQPTAPAPPKLPEPAADAKQEDTGDEPEIEVLPADEPVGDLGINTKARRRPRVPGSKPKKRSSLIGRFSQSAYLAGAAGGGIALVALIALGLVVFGGGSPDESANDAEPEVAVAEPVDPVDPEPEPTDPLAHIESDPDPLETDPVLPQESDPEEADALIAMAPADERPVEDGGAGEESADAGGEISADEFDSAADHEPPMDASETPPESGTEDDSEDASDPAREEEPPEETPEGEETPEEEETPEGDENQEEPEEEEPVEELPPPFSDLPAIVSIPSLDAGEAMEPVTLGNIYAGQGELCFIRMRGGSSAARGGHTFSMRNADGGLAERDWEISFRPSGGEDRLIAQLSWNDQSELVFQWQPVAADEPLAAHLVNCVLSFTCRGETHVAGFRRAESHPPLAIDWEEGTTRQEWEFPLPPEPDDLWVEIVQLEGAQHSIDPQPPIIRASRGEAWVRLAGAGGVLMLKIETDIRRGFLVTVSPHVRFRQDRPPERLNMRQLNTVRQNLQAMIQQGTMGMKQAKTVQSKLPEAQRKRAEQEMRTLENELNMEQETLKQFEEFEKLLKQVQPRLHLRLFYRADGSEVSMLRIGE